GVLERGEGLTAQPSWPGLSRPSTSFLKRCTLQGVDARHKAGHDGGEGDFSPPGGFKRGPRPEIECPLLSSVPRPMRQRSPRADLRRPKPPFPRGSTACPGAVSICSSSSRSA